MSEFIRGKRNFSVFDSLSTEELKEILRQDSQSSSSKSDIDAILYILEVLEKRENDKSDLEYEAKVALESFKDNYLPFADDPEPLYYDEENGINIDGIDGDDVEVIPFKEKPEIHPKKKYHKIKTTKIVLIAAVIAIIVGSVSAQALGFDIWKIVFNWTKETMGFSSHTVKTDCLIPSQLKEMEECMLKYGLSTYELPTIIPYGYSLKEFVCDEGNARIVLLSILTDEEGSEIKIRYTLYREKNDDIIFGGTEFQKSEKSIEIIETPERTFYVAENNNEYFSIWQKGNFEGYIGGVKSKDDLLDIISSINGA